MTTYWIIWTQIVGIVNVLTLIMNCRFLFILGHDGASPRWYHGLFINIILSFEYQLLISEDVLPYIHHLPLRFLIDDQVCAEVLYCTVNIVLDIIVLRCEFVLAWKLEFEIIMLLLFNSALLLFNDLFDGVHQELLEQLLVFVVIEFIVCAI